MVSTVTTNVSGSVVSIIVNIGTGDVADWEVVVSSKQDHGAGSSGATDYPYWVDSFTGTASISTNKRTYISGNYVAELALHALGVVDYSTFDIGSGGGGCADQGSKCDASGKQCYYNVVKCAFDCLPCPSGYTCQIQGGVAKCVVGTTCTPNWQCKTPKNGMIYDANNCPGSVDHSDPSCAAGTGGPYYSCNSSTNICVQNSGTANTDGCTAAGQVCGVTGGGACNDPLKLGCVGSIPITYIAAGLFMFMMMQKKR